ncbi:heavy metal translocating P-type ATPase [Halolamina salifodinae]|uniref:Heavy metal translocating P-type ATPase n=1 Tax=Halolamina salifodinae TaxID=1202767 RepID=A0A8T4GXP7_9EURY|nr:cation-translocating P-type ATPase [Halolamina salifodinae]MBP1986095.1 heavy metal translocating P-type ATPase [Halolamina salifodinae]
MGTTQEQFNVGGMSCSFCAESIEKAYRRTDGVADVDVSLAHEEVLVQYDADRISEVDVKDTLRDLGYTIRDPDKEKRYEEQQAELADGKRRLVLAGSASIVVAALMSWMIIVTGRFESESLAMDLVTLALALGTMFGPGRYIKEKAYQSLRRGILNQHVLLEAGAFAGLLGGFLGLFVFADFPTVHFFAVSVFITTYHILSEYTSLIVRTRASQAVQSLLDLRPDTARRVTSEARSASDRPSGESNGDQKGSSKRAGSDAACEQSDPRADETSVEEVPVNDLDVGDRVRVKPGESIPVDGEVVNGESTVDESVATGESIPEEKSPDDEVIGGSVNQTGTLLVEMTATGEDAFLNQVAHEIEEARAMKPGIIKLADRVLRYFVPAVLIIATLAFVFWLVAPLAWGADPNVRRGAFAALAVLVLGYPCALGMATPLALIRGGGKAANRGILMRSGDAFQVSPDIDHVVLDKTGTITVGAPAVSEAVALEGGTRGGIESEMLATAASAEAFSEHPLADAVLEYADERGIDYDDPEGFDSMTGRGVRATVDGDDVLVGKPEWLDGEGIDISGAADEVQRLQRRGLTVSGVTRDGDLVGLLGIGDGIKGDAAATVRRMTDAGITPVMITGDNQRTAAAVAEEVGIDRVMADVLPDEKREEIGRLQDGGHRVAMVGDGINDAPALTQADIGIAIGAGTDIAIESADIVLMGDRLGGVMDAHEIGTESYRKTRQNLAAAFAFNGIGVAAATTGLVHPVFAMIAMVLSVSAVLANSFAGQLLSGEGVNTGFSVENGDVGRRGGNGR